MTRRLTAALAACLAFALAQGPAAADALSDLKAKGKIVVAIDPTFSPFEFTDSSGKIVGYDPELIEAVASSLGVKVDYQVMAFSGIIPGLVAGSFDLTPTLNVTAERAQRIAYTIPTASSVNAVLALKTSPVKGSKIDDLSGLKCAVKQTTQPEQMMTAMNADLKAAGKKPVDLLGFDTIEQTVAALAAKRVDCVVDDKSVLVEAVEKRPDVPMQVVGELGPATPIAWAVNKTNAPLADVLSAEIKKLKASGKLKDLQMKYFKYATELPESGFIPAK